MVLMTGKVLECLVIECRSSANEFEPGLCLTLEFEGLELEAWGSLSLVLMKVFLSTMLTVKGVSVRTKLRPELLMLERSLSQTLLASILENLKLRVSCFLNSVNFILLFVCSFELCVFVHLRCVSNLKSLF